MLFASWLVFRKCHLLNKYGNHTFSLDTQNTAYTKSEVPKSTFGLYWLAHFNGCYNSMPTLWFNKDIGNPTVLAYSLQARRGFAETFNELRIRFVFNVSYSTFRLQRLGQMPHNVVCLLSVLVLHHSVVAHSRHRIYCQSLFSEPGIYHHMSFRPLPFIDWHTLTPINVQNHMSVVKK